MSHLHIRVEEPLLGDFKDNAQKAPHEYGDKRGKVSKIVRAFMASYNRACSLNKGDAYLAEIEASHRK